MARPKTVPGYLYHKASGRAFVRINGTNIYLGTYNSRASKEEYDRILKEWLANGRQLAQSSNTFQSVTVNEICVAFLEHARVYYRKNGRVTAEVTKLEIACRLLYEHCGTLPATEFSRKNLRAIQQTVINLGWKRGTVNERIGHVKRIFKWAAKEDMIPASVYQELLVLENLKKGRSPCPESEKILPVPYDIVEKTLPFCPPVIADMARVQYLAAMRPGEICALRYCDIDRSNDVWEFDYREHKMAHHEHDRIIWFGKQAQAILIPYLMDAEGNPEKFLFSPRETVRVANIEKRKKRKTKVQPSQANRAKKCPKVGPGNQYEVSSYRRALQRAAENAGVEKWFPNQLRHSRATEIRKEFGLEAAQIILGHAKADVTQVYAERDNQKGIDVMRKIG